MTTGKTITLTRWSFVGKVMSLLFNMLSTLVIAFLPRSKRLLISWLQSLSAVTLEPKNLRDYYSDHELLIAKFRLKLKKVGKTARPFRYDLSQILHDYTVEVRNRFKGLDLIEREPDEHRWRFVTLYRKQGSRPSPWERNAKKQNGCLGRPYK